MPSDGAPGRIRTPDPQIRSLVLYPAELPVLKNIAFGILKRSTVSAVRSAGHCVPRTGRLSTADWRAMQAPF